VAHFLDGRVMKGATEDFDPAQQAFTLHPVGSGSAMKIESRKLKALFFVRNLAGDPGRDDAQGFVRPAGESEKGKKIAIQFKDGEMLFGYALTYTNDDDGFYVAPADPSSNNMKIYVIRSATQKVLVGPQAEAFAKTSRRKAA
jgi:hypothetical protein